MNDRFRPLEEPAEGQAVQGGPGARLRRGREAMGWSREDIAARLNLSASVVAALEADDYDKGPGPTFMRGYLRGYASLVRLPPAEIVAAFDQRVGVKGYEATPRPTRRHKSQARMSDRPVRWFTYLIVGGLLVLTGLWWQGHISPLPPRGGVGVESPSIASAPTAPSPAPAPEVSASAPAPAATAAPASAAGEESASVNLPGATPTVAPEAPTATVAVAAPTVAEPPMTAPAAANALAPTAPPAPVPAVGPSPAAAAMPVLRLSFTGDSWVDIKDATGKRLAYGINKAGQVLELDGTPPFSLVLGNAPVVTLQYRGEVVDHGPLQRHGVARFQLDQDGSTGG